MNGARHRLLPGREGAAIRDLDKAQRKQVARELIEFTEVYAEPMFVKFPRPAKAVLLVRLQEEATPETPVPASAVVSFTNVSGGIRIDEIDGPVLGESYRYVLEVIG